MDPVGTWWKVLNEHQGSFWQQFCFPGFSSLFVWLPAKGAAECCNFLPCRFLIDKSFL